MSAAAAVHAIGITGEYRLRGDAATSRPDLTHSFSFAASDVAAIAAPALPAAACVGKPQRTTANTFASTPSEIARSCPTEPTLAALALLLHKAKEESDRYLTACMKDEEERGAAAGVGLNNQSQPAGSAQKKRKAKNDEAEDDADADADDADGKKAKLDDQ